MYVVRKIAFLTINKGREKMCMMTAEADDIYTRDDESFECYYDGTCHRPKGSCRHCTHARLKSSSQKVKHE